MADSWSQAGPMVQMILARRRAEADTPSAVDGCLCFNLSPDSTGMLVGYNNWLKVSIASISFAPPGLCRRFAR